jgi:hypothetical protein
LSGGTNHTVEEDDDDRIMLTDILEPAVESNIPESTDGHCVWGPAAKSHTLELGARSDPAAIGATGSRASPTAPSTIKGRAVLIGSSHTKGQRTPTRTLLSDPKPSLLEAPTPSSYDL